MPVIISMLRAVNLVRHNRIKMDALRTLYTSLKLEDPRTYVQSGNVIFRTKERDLVLVAKKIQNGIERSFGFRPEVILRTTSELRDVIARNPFAKRRGIDPRKLLVTFLAGDPGAEARELIRKMKDRKSTRLNSSHLVISYAVFCLKTKRRPPNTKARRP